jgi:dTDP-4-dehydrorhamnose 3,5-epimerase
VFRKWQRSSALGPGDASRYNGQRGEGIASKGRSQAMAFIEGDIEGVIVRPLDLRADARGWLVELYRADELPADLLPQMAYVSETAPGVARGPHEHREQSDCFAFLGPGEFRLYLWDARPASSTFEHRQVLDVGASNRRMVVVPPGVVHAYQNVGGAPGWVFNAANRLYAGPGRSEPVDEIRHENVAGTPYLLD